MCGIGGWFNLDGAPASSTRLDGMARRLSHRGPDGEGIYCEGPLGLAHRRLAIIDLSDGGRQPMFSADGRYVLTYNGEIYNYRELRKELQTLGHRFVSQSDSEVLLAAFCQWGADCLQRLNGMFAFGIWDRKDQTLFLARDRYGIKPLYFIQVGSVFMFASEIKAFFENPDFEVTVNQKALLEYLTFQNLFLDHSLFQNVSILRPGWFMTIDGNGRVRSSEYWDFLFQEPENPRPYSEYLEELDGLMIQAVSRQLIADVDVCSYLSGGMDSGTITAIAATQRPYIKSFTVGFDLSSASGVELGFDERRAAELMSYRFKTEHYEMVLKAGDMERAMRDLVWHLEEPRVGQSYPNFYAAKLASRFGKVVLSGAGGDEMFAGYPWRYYRAAVNDNFEAYVDKYYKFWQRLIDNKHLNRMVAPIADEVRGVWTRDIMRDVLAKYTDSISRPEDYVNRSLYFEARTFLHGLLIVEDKLSMAHGLESRVPFLDNDLVDFAMRLPIHYKLGNLGEIIRINENDITKHYDFPTDGKLMLRQMMARHIPPEISGGKKQGFSAPDASWFRGDSIEYVRDTLLYRNAHIYDFLDYDATVERINEHLDGETNRRLLIWSLLNFETWLDLFPQHHAH